MRVTSQATRLIGLIITVIGLIISGLLYFRAPWTLNVMDFLGKPLLLFALPIIITGISLVLQPRTLERKVLYPLTVGFIGVIGTLLIYDWPNETSLYFWEDSYQTLAVLEAAYLLLSIPFLGCCFKAVSESLPKKAG